MHFSTMLQNISYQIQHTLVFTITNILSWIALLVSIVVGDDSSRNETDDSMEKRMAQRIRRFNGHKCHPFKPHIVSLKSKALLKYINHVSRITDKEEDLRKLNEIVFAVCQCLYNRFDPHAIYAFNNEIHIVFFYNDMGEYPYNGDINRTITSIASFAGGSFMQQFAMHGMKVDSVLQGTFVEFDKDYEVLNYLVWRQYDCKRNNIALLYKCLFHHTNVKCDRAIQGLCIDSMHDAIEDIYVIPQALLLGNLIKKQRIYKPTDAPDEVITRKEIVVVRTLFNDDFRQSLQRYIVNKIL